MVRHLQARQSRGAAPDERLDLSNVVLDRLNELEPDERRILELVALCGQPTERGLLLRAAGLGGAGWPLVAPPEDASGFFRVCESTALSCTSSSSARSDGGTSS